ncbi:hypothetical protein LCGC14_2504340, partial [marine sediment metagenome]
RITQITRMGSGEMPCSAHSIRGIRVIRGFFVVEPDFVTTVSKKALPPVWKRRLRLSVGRQRLGLRRLTTSDGLQQQAQQAIQEAFGQERGAQQASSMFAPQLAQQDYADIGRLADVGGVRQGQGQAQLSDLVNRWNFAQNQPQNQLNAFMGNVGGGYGGTTSSTVPYYSNMGAGILGGAATGAGIGSMFGANDFSSMLPYILAGGGLGGFG